MTMLTTIHSQSSGEEFFWLWKACATTSTEILYVQTMADEWFQFYGTSWFDIEHGGGHYPSFCFALSVLVAKGERLKQFTGFLAKTWAPLRSGLTLLSHRLQFCVTSCPGSFMLSVFYDSVKDNNSPCIFICHWPFLDSCYFQIHPLFNEKSKARCGGACL